MRRAGVDYMHPDLGGGFGPGFRVAYGYDFVGDNGNGDYGTAYPDGDPRDTCQGAPLFCNGSMGHTMRATYSSSMEIMLGIEVSHAAAPGDSAIQLESI